MREQECSEGKGKVVIALYSGHYTDLIWACKCKTGRLLSRVGHCFTLRRRTVLTSSTEIIKFKIYTTTNLPVVLHWCDLSLYGLNHDSRYVSIGCSGFLSTGCSRG
jgi:hypothetical protein